MEAINNFETMTITKNSIPNKIKEIIPKKTTYTFVSERMEKKVIPKSSIYWGQNMSWRCWDEETVCGNYEMPRGIWCMVQSYGFNMFGKWKIIES